jgi:uncharacterized protein YgiM (DUF1202 family)
MLCEVCDCAKLNIRSKPNADSEVVCVVNVGTTLEVNAVSDSGWARVYTAAGMKGYAMKKFIKEI